MERCLGRLDLVERILQAYAQQATVDLVSLQNAAQCGNFAEVARVAHRLKGASASCSATAIRDSLAQLEEQAKRESASELEESLTQLTQLLAAFISGDEIEDAGAAN